MQPMRFKSVVFPLPEAPDSATNSPVSISRVTSRRAVTSTLPSVYDLRMLCSLTSGVFIVHLNAELTSDTRNRTVDSEEWLGLPVSGGKL